MSFVSKISIALFSITFFIVSCFDQTVKEHAVSDSTLTQNIDTVLSSTSTLEDAELNSEEAIQENTVFSVPFLFDSIKLTKIETNIENFSKLNYKEVRKLTKSAAKDDFTQWSIFNINEFIRIDSLKSVEKYNKYLETIDIGMTQNSDAFHISDVSFANGLSLVLWGVRYSTYEACPYAEGIVVFGTYKKEGKLLNYQLISETSSGSDAPVWVKTQISASITEDKISLYRKIKNGDEDPETGKEMITETFDTIYHKKVAEVFSWVK